jgi:hypothetical protein
MLFSGYFGLIVSLSFHIAAFSVTKLSVTNTQLSLQLAAFLNNTHA